MDFKAHLAKDVGKTVAEATAKCVDPILEPKYDGWRCIVIRDESGARIFNRSQKEYTGKLPELEADLAKLPVGTILDGELVCMTYDVDTARWENDFFRIHTCMRSNMTIAKQREGIKLITFDCIARPYAGEIVRLAVNDLPTRRAAVQHLISTCGLQMVELTIQLPAKQEMHDDLVAAGFEGSIVKCQRAPYAFGKRGHGWFKIKDVRTIDCVVMEVDMNGKGQHLGKAGRMHVGQYKDGELVRVAAVNCLNNAQRDEATAHPERFVGRVIEVKIYGWDTEGPRHPTPMRFREDKPAAECVWSRV
jgi:ATP-dependent DNA ligase